MSSLSENAQESSPQLDESPLRIIIVDDTKANREFLACIIRHPGRDVVCFGAGSEALAYIEQEPDIALALLDVQMPEMDGYAVARAIRQRPSTTQVPIIFITASAHEEQGVFKAYDAGAVDFLFRPVDAHILRSKVDVFCRLHAQKRIIQGQLDRISKQHAALQQQLEEIKVLRGMIPICASCKSVRNDTGFWEAIESYVQTHSEAAFSHSLCPDCVERLYPDFKK